MARKLISVYFQNVRFSSQETTSTVSDSEQSWNQWRFVETVRRTIFLVNIINNLSCRTGKQEPCFHEEVNDELISTLPLPSHESVWKADSEDEWLGAQVMAAEEERLATSNQFTTLILATMTPLAGD
jgi:hypothetical protein